MTSLRSARLAVSRLDPAREAVNALFGASPSSRRAWAKALRLLPASRDAETLVLRGRAHAALGNPAAAEKAFSAALRRAPGDAETLARRAEALLIFGDAAGAETAARRSMRANPGRPWPRLTAGLCRLTDGDVAGAKAEFALAAAAPAAWPAATALLALADGQAGDLPAALARLDAALAERATPPLRAVRGLLRRDARDFTGAAADLAAAAKADPSPGFLCHQADALTRGGFYRAALKVLDRAASLAPDSAAPHAQASNVYFDQAFYPEAMAAMTRALKRAPGDPVLLARRARILTVLSRLDEAARDLARAQRLAPQDLQIRFERLQILARTGARAEVDRAASRGAVGPAFGGYLLGYTACRAGEYPEGAARFLAAAAAGAGDFAERCRLYARVCRVLAAPPAGPEVPPPALYLCGIGIKHPFEATVEMILALKRSRVLYNNMGDPQIADFLGLFGGEVRAVRRVFGEPAMGRVRRIVGTLPRDGAPAAFVTRIHPFIYRLIANDLAEVCVRQGISFRAFGAVSLTEAAWGLGASADPAAPPAAPAAMGGRVFDLAWLVRHPRAARPQDPTVIYCIADTRDRKAFVSLLRRKWPFGHPGWMLAGSGDREHEAVALSLDADFEDRLVAADRGTVFYLPAVRGRA